MKNKKWQSTLIIIVLSLTLYNILPTVFYYSKPLKSPITEKKANEISSKIADRVNNLEKESIDWIKSYCKLLNLSPKSIQILKDRPSHIEVEFTKIDDAKILKKFLPRSGNIISFVPSQLNLSASEVEKDSKRVLIHRKIPITLEKGQLGRFFKFTKKFDSEQKISSIYKDLLFDRASEISYQVGGTSENSYLVDTIHKNPSSALSKEITLSLVYNILDYSKQFEENSPILNRYFSTFTQNDLSNKKELINNLVKSIDFLREEIKLDKAKIKSEISEEMNEELQQKIAILEKREISLLSAKKIINNNLTKFCSGKSPIFYEDIYNNLEKDLINNSLATTFRIDLKSNNPFIKSLTLDCVNDKIYFNFHSDILALKKTLKNDKSFDQLLINEIAKITNKTAEKISLENDEVFIKLSNIENTNSFVLLDLKEVSKEHAKTILNTLNMEFSPSHEELLKDNFPIYSYDEFLKLDEVQKRYCLVVYSSAEEANKLSGFKKNSTYVIAKGLDQIFKKYRDFQSSKEANLFAKDFNKLESILRQNGFNPFFGSNLNNAEYQNDLIFEQNDFYKNLLLATREDFNVKGSKKFAYLELSDLEQRILTENKIENSIQEELIKQKDDYFTSQNSLDSETKYDVPKPVKSPLINNLKLSVNKYFHGDERKVLHWGLDLSGGKTVTIELRDQNGKVVTDEAALKQGINELYSRVNKLGVSEVSIRTVDSNIVLDFPGAQNLSADDLVKASSMYFHVVNEKFTPTNRELSDHVNKFLTEVYNEAIVTNKKDPKSINEIAYKHLHGETSDSSLKSESAKILIQNGLKIADPNNNINLNSFDYSLCKIALFRGDDYKKWSSQTHPLLIVFNNFTLDGTSLANIRSAYDPSKGNYLTFDVKSSNILNNSKKIFPREDLFKWTSTFSKEKIQGTPFENFSKGRGYRMAVILNDTVISAPTLESALKDSAMISGNFSLREVSRLTNDLKAGSLSFTPNILSEKNVSPELGIKDRTKGIAATFIAFALVIAVMIFYYRFAGIVASIAVLINLLIIWATLQNIQATLTLAGIAGVILTVGMAVDANVLVFERIKEEFSISKNISSAINSGYKRAFSAIFDSNITTIIAALILLNFDSGPIKGFAVTLIIGIVSSMFSALFMTRFFFSRWAQNEKNTNLKMLNFVQSKNVNFLKISKFVAMFSIITIILGSFLLYKQKSSIIGMDFTGGYTLNIEIQNSGIDYREAVNDALIKSGLSSSDFQIRELSPVNNLRISLAASLQESLFKNLKLNENINTPYQYEKNPKIVWMINALKGSNIELTKKSLESLDKNWTVMSGQMSDSMRNSAIIALSLALAAIFIYIAFRFEFKYAASAMLCLVHDILITLGFMGILHLLKVPMQIDLNTIAALMTIIGYSLNDTIVIFDRIREDLKFSKNRNYPLIVNNSLNTTISRTTLTSFTTLVALLGLVIFGGGTIFNFALVMTIGILFGTLSSIFIASPLMLYFHKIENKRLVFKKR
ncbi:MAG: hypothetical protein A3F40_03705 [Chlamydiae bacterium RIFCSPHIGHO2_12_FULL_27_8]|nr:MAG: hypothetical protein A3F40_03705 [Chlamydiae bacterium RIFCSPHIGHO2_12_FULL_27_8]